MTVLTRAVARVRIELERRLRQTKDPNFIGFDKYAKHGAYHWRELAHNGDYQSKADFVRSRTQPSDRLIDLGCGDGAYIFSLAKDVDGIKGVDADFDAARLANEQLEKSGVTNADVEQIPLSKVGLTPGTMGPYDVAYSMDVIEHLPRPEELLEAASRVVRPKGLIVIGTPLFIRPELVSPYHVKEFAREEINGIVRSRAELVEEHLLPEMRSDGQIYEAFYIAVARPVLP
jgi:2-polyprenyl-3-methyl-5-hydroxy-6-metoxy-1,4-benzoquinol methylase